MADPFNVDFNIGIFGEGRVGKTCLIKRYVDDNFSEFEETSSNADAFEKTLTIDKTVVNLNIYDLPGQETYHQLAKNYMKGLNGVILVYDIITKGTYEKIDFWYEQMKEALDDVNKIPFLLIGNKCDLEENRVVTKEEGLKFVENKKNMIFYECSAKSGLNVEKAINELAANILKCNRSTNEENPSNSGAEKKADDDNKGKKKKKKCYLF